MESFIRYLYEYKNEQRIRNVGFVKVDQNENGGTLQIHGRGTFLNNANIKVYLIYMTGRKCYGIPMGELEGVQSIISCRLIYERTEIEKYTASEKIAGILLDAAGQGVYVAVWDETVIPIDQMKIAVLREECPSTEENKEAARENAEENIKDTGEDEGETVPEETQGMELTAAWNAGENENVQDSAFQQSRAYRKIDRADMTELPRKSWYLANNSFLLHGYYNYHHLLLAKEDGKTYLGVPGVYHQREAAAAQSFGFPEFHRLPEGTLELSAQECDRDQSFGYWCRKIEKE